MRMVTARQDGGGIQIAHNIGHRVNGCLLYTSTNLNPTMQVILTQNSNSGVLHDIEINAQVQWNSPLARGGQIQVEIDMLRTVDVPNL